MKSKQGIPAWEVLQILAAPLLQKLLVEFPISPHPAGLPLRVLLPQQHSHSGCCSHGSTPTQGAASFGSTPTQGAAPTAALPLRVLLPVQHRSPIRWWLADFLNLAAPRVGVLQLEQHSEWGCCYKRGTTGSSTSTMFFYSTYRFCSTWRK